MSRKAIYIAGTTAASRWAGTYLTAWGLPVVCAPDAGTGHLLLDVPSFGPEGQLRMGGAVEDLLHMLPDDVRVYGGNLNHTALKNHRSVDFLRDPDYLAENAYITAECALDVALPYLTVTLRGCPVLIMGWGRIGKCLGQLLKNLGADVTIAARKEADRAMIRALGYRSEDMPGAAVRLNHFRLIFNTVPAPVLNQTQTRHCREDCVIIELASQSGIDHPNVILARGLPGIHLPESTGKLMAETFLRYYKEVTQ